MTNVFEIATNLLKRSDWNTLNMYLNNYNIYVEPVIIKIDSSHVCTKLRNKYTLLKTQEILIKNSNYKDKLNLLQQIQMQYFEIEQTSI